MFEQSYEYISQQGYSYDDITRVYDRIRGSAKEPEIRECFGEDSLEGRTVFLEALQKYFDEKPYDEETLAEIADYKRDFQYYPDTKEPTFVKQLTQKKEMAINFVFKNLKTAEEKCNREFFELAPHQVFLKNLMSKSSPYNGLLIFHGVGVGKTCSAITIAENFKDTYKDKTKRIIILASQNIQIGWRKTIYDPQKGDNQCTGDTYNLEDDRDSPIHNLEKQQKRQIKAYYELHGYASFANSVKRMLQRYLGKDVDTRDESEISPYIDQHYSDRLLVIDEVHNIRTGNDTEVRDTIHYINLVIKHSHGLKLVLLTANPMYNMADEIVWILNMLLLNDGRPKIDAKLFEDGLTREGARIIESKCQGYVSYIRGENPVSFPVRLYPDHGQMITSVNAPDNDIFGNPLQKKDRLSFLQIYGTSLRGFQQATYQTQLKHYLRERQEPDVPPKQASLQIQEESRLLQLSNIAYPVDSDDPGEACGDTGLSKCFHITRKQGKTEYRYKEGFHPFLDEELIGEFSAKIASILRCIRESDGIVFVYTNWIGSGVIPLVLALEQNGYQKYDGSTILRCSQKRPPLSYNGKQLSGSEGIPAKYMVIAGTQENLTHNLAEELKVATSSENNDGSRIKVIIGSSVAAEGLDFKCIRSIHVLEPWHNLNKVEQVIGRGVRNCSHGELSPEERNVTIYLHGIQDDTRETIDLRLYRYAEKKAKVIGDVETILKQGAIDRHLFKNMNRLTDLEVGPIQVKPAYRKSKPYTYVPKDQPFTRVCSFQPTCDYLKDSVAISREPNTDTFSFQYLQGITDVYAKRITKIVREIGAFTFHEMYAMIGEYQVVDTTFLERALQQMVSLKTRITNVYGEPGYLATLGDIFVFQPAYNPDPTLPYYYRHHRGDIHKHERDLQIVEKRESEVSSEDIAYTTEELQQSLNVVAKFYWNLKETLVKKRFHISKISQFGYIYDRIHYEHRKALVYLSLVKSEDADFKPEFREWVQCAREYCARFHVGYDETSDTYQYGDIYETNGCFLYHATNKRVYGYTLRDKTLSLMNEIDQQQLLSDLAVSKKLFAYPKESIAFMLYVSRYKNQHGGMVCKVVDHQDKGGLRQKQFTYPPGEGTIIRDTNTNDSRILSLDPITFILREFPEKMRSLGESQIEEIRNENSRIELCAMIEMFFREKNRCLSQDIAWLRYL